MFPAPVDAPVRREWRIEWRGSTFRESDLTGKHLAALAMLAGEDDWRNLDVESPVDGPFRLMKMITAFLIVAGDGSPPSVASAVETVGNASADEVLAALRFD